MKIDAHDLVSEFPEHKARIHDLKTKDAHFRRLFDDYGACNHSIHLIEEGAEHAADEELENLKKKRLNLKDELFKILQAA